VVLYEGPCISHIDEGPLGRIGNAAPRGSEVTPMGLKRFALQRAEYAFL
jgi:hypothetical protein